MATKVGSTVMGDVGLTATEVLAHLTDGTTSVVLVGGDGMPSIAHWGTALGDGPISASLFERPVVGGGLDVDPPAGLVAEASTGWFGRPGLEVHRGGGRDPFPRFTIESIVADEAAVVVDLADPAAGLALRIELTLHPTGVLAVRASVTNTGDDSLQLAALRLTLPVPDQAQELLTIGGRHTMEFLPTRRSWDGSCVTVENRHGKTSHERLGVVFAGTEDFGEHQGEVWACHIGWSGNYELVCDAITDGRKVIQAGELLMAGEVELGPGESYATPVVYAAYSSDGLNTVSNRFHDHLRARPHHPHSRRPVILNTWEAVYFDHDLDTLRRLADLAAEVGVERFVLDDGWFGARRDDTGGLGDWVVSDEVWPDGLGPIIDHVRGRGMEFGIWVEPEMVNTDSDLYRAHPDWALVDHRYEPVLGRNQLVLDIGRAEVRDHLFEQLDALLADHEISYVKWDHNRDLVAPVSGGRAGAHRQTLGAYELFDRLRSAHPGVEFETCASGGGRVDFGILERTDRVWTSDSIDALDRHLIQHGFSLLFPPELMGSHIGAPRAHTTGRVHRLGFRAVPALFGSLGVEWNLLETTPDERLQLAQLIALHKRFRPLLHTGRIVRLDHPDDTVEVHGVVSTDQREALLAATRLASSATHHTAPVRVHGLADEVTYELQILDEIGEPPGGARQEPAWVDSKLLATGRQLRATGFRLPQLRPETSLVVHLQAAG